MRPSFSICLLFQAITWLDIAKKSKRTSVDWFERDMENAAIYHRMWLDHTWPA